MKPDRCPICFPADRDEHTPSLDAIKTNYWAGMRRNSSRTDAEIYAAFERGMARHDRDIERRVRAQIAAEIAGGVS